MELMFCRRSIVGKNVYETNFETISMSDGNFAYCRILQNIVYCINNGMLKLPKTYNDIVIYINVDGLPLFKGSRVGLWPILMTIKGCKYPKPLPIAIFCGIVKPPLTKFLE